MAYTIIATGPKAKNITGKIFGRLTAIAPVERVQYKKSAVIKWLCLCECTTEVVVLLGSLTGGRTKSCGCLNTEMIIERNAVHNRSESLEYGSWSAMKTRCYNKSRDDYRHYGGRGIDVCDRWLESFENFYADMGPRPSAKHTLERRKNHLGYSPENCYWATPKQQARNTRRNHMITHNGKTQCLTEWAEEIGIIYGTLSNRIRRGWPIEEALTPANPVGTNQTLRLRAKSAK